MNNYTKYVNICGAFLGMSRPMAEFVAGKITELYTHPDHLKGKDLREALANTREHYCSRFVWNIGAVQETLPDMPDQDAHDAVVLWDRQDQRVVMTIAREYGNAFCLETTSSKENAPFSNCADWLNALDNECIESEGMTPTRPEWWLNVEPLAPAPDAAEASDLSADFERRVDGVALTKLIGKLRDHELRLVLAMLTSSADENELLQDIVGKAVAK